MSHRLRLYWYASLLLSLMPVGLAHAANPRLLPELALQQATLLDANQPAATRLSQLKPAGRWVLLVLDANLASTAQFLGALKADGFDGKQAVVVIVGGQAASSRLLQTQALPAQLRWAVADTQATLSLLKIGGTPALYAINAQQEIAWQSYGYPKRPGDWLVSMWAGWVERCCRWF
jgi:hypothetical protein